MAEPPTPAWPDRALKVRASVDGGARLVTVEGVTWGQVRLTQHALRPPDGRTRPVSSVGRQVDGLVA